ncbi:MAG: LamG domain-containing protein [Chitinophagaceae bacterium]|nr:LamG domain-containing protein [Chitinophagaceae bacterium]
MKKLLLPLLLAANVCFAQVDLNLGLKAYYPFSGNANDISGNNNNPVFNNATLTADRLGNPNSAYHFNGIDTYMRIPDNPTLKMNDKLSISLWVKPTGWYTGQCYNNMMVIKGDGDNVAGRYSSRFSDVFNGCSATPSTTEERFFDGFGNAATVPIVQLNQWYSVVITFDGTTSKIYVNCVLQGTVNITRNFTNTHDLFIGHLNSAQFPYWLNGDLDEIRLYDRALNQDEVNVLGSCVTTPASCSNWLRTQAVGQSVTVGDLDISGNQVTVEANFNCSSFPVTRPDKWQDIVSKHSTTTDINYVLRMDLAGITTTNGQFLTPPPCDNLVTNKTYHVALVYDGSTLKLYRNGIIISQIAAAGNLVLNNWLTTIGDYAVNNPVGTNFLGYINEVRIWNVARTQAQLQTYMNASLPNPATQTGLQGYYTFDNLLNKQGNAAYNGTLNGGATINNVNPNCTFTPEQGIIVNAGTDTSFCSNGPVSHVLQGSGNGTYSWTPAIYLNNPNIQNPTATVSTTTTFYLTVTGNPSFCSGTDSVTIFVTPPPVVNTIADTTICMLSPLVLTTNSNALTFQWTPAVYVSNPNIANPNFIGTGSQRLYVTGSTGPGCSAIDSVDVFVNPLPVVQTIDDTTLCFSQSITLTSTGAQTYSWNPAAGLNNPNIASPVFTGSTTQTYTVTGTDAIGCADRDTVTIFSVRLIRLNLHLHLPFAVSKQYS